MKRGRLEYDIAYGCFLILAIAALVLIVIRSSYTDAEWAGGGGAILILLLPFIVVPLIAMVVGIVLSIRLWNHRPLVVLAVSTILLLTDGFLQFMPDSLAKAVSILYCVGTGVTSVWWFLRLRKLLFPRSLPAVKE